MNITAESASPIRVWFHPAKLWQATEKMTQTEADSLMEHLYELAQRRAFAELARYDFIRIGPYRDVNWH